MKSLANLSDLSIPKVQSTAIGYVAVKLVKPGDAIYVSNGLCHVTEITTSSIIGIDLNSKNKQIKYDITDKDAKIRFLYLDSHTFMDRKVYVDKKLNNDLPFQHFK